MIERDAERDAWQLLASMIPLIGEVIPGDQLPMTLARAVRTCRRAYGDAAEAMLGIEIRLH